MSDRKDRGANRARDTHARGAASRRMAADAAQRGEHAHGVMIRRPLLPVVRGHEGRRGGLLRRLVRLSVGGLVVAGAALLAARPARPVVARAVVTIGRRPGELHDFWRDVENLARVFPHVREVRALDRRHSRWTVEGPGGAEVTWVARVVEDTPSRIAWRSEAGGEVEHEGEVRFLPAPGDRGTEVHVTISYRPPFRRLGAAFAALSGTEASQTLREGLRRLKMLMETGEIATTKGQPSGRGVEIREAGRPLERLGEAANVLVTGGAT